MAASSVSSSTSTALNSTTASNNAVGGGNLKSGGGAKYPNAVRPGGSEFLRRRLEKGHKFFDSGDYNMAKANEKLGGGGGGPHLGPVLAGGGAGAASAAAEGGNSGNVAQFPSTQPGQMNRKPMHQLLPTIGDDNENPKPALSPDEIRTSKNSPPPKTSKLATT